MKKNYNKSNEKQNIKFTNVKGNSFIIFLWNKLEGITYILIFKRSCDFSFFYRTYDLIFLNFFTHKI